MLFPSILTLRKSEGSFYARFLKNREIFLVDLRNSKGPLKNGKEVKVIRAGTTY